jgi:methylenetetrahydrofolate dehydrogenase (NADP+) / methenyltetrahydrofolate cyclohydrolase
MERVMATVIIDGKIIADEIRQEIKSETIRLKQQGGITPALAFILVGDNPASQSYVKMKGKGCEEVGFRSITEKLSADVPESELLRLIDRFNRDKTVHGILVQLPLPRHINEGKIIASIDYRKDVDGFHPINIGRLVAGQDGFKPCTPVGVQELLLRSGNDPGGKHVVIVGRSNIVGKPLANIFMQKQKGANAIVTIAHTGAKNISAFTKEADILVAAIGRPEFVTGDMVKRGVVVIDVGINRVEDPSAKAGYRIVGDVHFASVSQVASAITPVPGGVGPMTIAMVLRNTLYSAQGKYY